MSCKWGLGLGLGLALTLTLTLTHRVHVGRPQVALKRDLGRLIGETQLSGDTGEI